MMYNGKHQTPAVKGKGERKAGILIISLALLLMAVIGGTVAYLLDSTDQITNTFTPAEVKITINENKDGNTKKNITFTNPTETNAVPVYVRATLVVYWKDAEGKIVPQPDGGNVQAGAVNADDGWFEIDGIYYYHDKVSPGNSTPPMLKDEIIVPGSDPEAKAEVVVTTVAGYTCYVDIRAEAIQAEPETVVKQAWSDIQVANGQLKAK